ncbi:MAG: hypothetical protein PHW18_03410 [Sulfuricurvum sp.]|uniref:hypothetical protein n=1 Tax=Sulfuricurvum sp. TaxID=2025608 RepID=UPI002605720B|nr:hypothetical protein [Sulfuricurvum sp.]MDD2828605.1 hypothetical protein [Sulfuricurvum sp.]MDD4948282.1 hypothetical protein [Sulfuricurvum sp.]
MNLRKEIEKLIYWYVPILLVALVFDFIIGAHIKSTNDTSSLVVWGYASASIIINYLHHFVIAIWLYVISKQLNQKYILWSLFGLVAHLFALVIFLVLYVYEKNHGIENNEINQARKKLFIWSK